MDKPVVVVSGYFNPLHRGHIEYFKLAKQYAGKDGLVYVIVNSDNQSLLKKKFSFIPEEDRLEIIKAIKYVDYAMISIDTDRTVCKSIEWLCNNKKKPTHFANGGDVNVNNKCPEEQVCVMYGINLLYGLGDKIQSSSWILEKSVKEAHNILFE
jgi:D-beta-D-heptose 7-phosphate kinase/D-beta-D-heptose 1-phosphate adenosyltransferase